MLRSISIKPTSILEFLENVPFRKTVPQHESFLFVLSLVIDINCQRFCHGSSKWQLIKRVLTRPNIEDKHHVESLVYTLTLRFIRDYRFLQQTKTTSVRNDILVGNSMSSLSRHIKE